MKVEIIMVLSLENPRVVMLYTMQGSYFMLKIILNSHT